MKMARGQRTRPGFNPVPTNRKHHRSIISRTFSTPTGEAQTRVGWTRWYLISARVSSQLQGGLQFLMEKSMTNEKANIDIYSLINMGDSV